MASLSSSTATAAAAAATAAAAAATKSAQDIEDQTRALQSKVADLEQDRDNQRNRAAVEVAARQDEIETLKSQSQLSEIRFQTFQKGAAGIETHTADLRKQQRAAEEEMRQLQLYTFTKMEHCGAAISKLASHLAQAVRERDHLKTAVAECDTRIGPLIREKRRCSLNPKPSTQDPKP
jgi:chromosome segregation ATPase